MLTAFLAAAITFAQADATVSCPDSIPVLRYEIVDRRPHDPDAFTQGLVLRAGILYESTGGYGTSSLRIVDVASGRVWRRRDLARDLFAEGMTRLDNEIWVLSWKSGVARVFDPQQLRAIRQYTYSGEGWGLTDDGRVLIMSDGSSTLRFRDPRDFSVIRSLRVRAGDTPVGRLNELESVGRHIYANVWLTDRIARIDAGSGCVDGWLNLQGLLPAAQRKPPVDVLNGIAYDRATEIFYVTGKRWPTLFLIRLIP